jgi:hypothetical protein
MQGTNRSTSFTCAEVALYTVNGISIAYARTMCIPLNKVFRDGDFVPKIAVLNFFHAFSILDLKNITQT